MVMLESNPGGGYLSSGMARVGVRTSCVPGGNTMRFSWVIHKNRFSRLCGKWEESQSSSGSEESSTPSSRRRDE